MLLQEDLQLPGVVVGVIVCLLAGSGYSILILLASRQHNLYDIYLLLYVQCCLCTPDAVCILLMMDRETV
jgi:hypothetical protein